MSVLTSKDIQKYSKYSVSQLKLKAQAAFNAWIRKRDDGQPCISCGTGSPNQAGHFYSAGHYSSLRYSSRSINEFLKHIAAKAKIDNKRIYAHLIRHCTFTHMLENGTDLSIIQKVAGHSSIKVTQGYTHISNNLIRRTYSPLQSISL